MQFYRDTAEAYLFIKIVVSPLLCILGWVLLGKILSRRLNAYAHWFFPAVIATSLSAGGALPEPFVSFYARRDYILAAGVYLFYFASLPFHLVSFVRLWQTISRLSPAPARCRAARNKMTAFGPRSPELLLTPNNGGARVGSAC